MSPVFWYFRVYHSQVWVEVPTTLALPLHVLQDNAFSKSRLQESSEDLWGEAASLFWTIPPPATSPPSASQLERVHMRLVLVRFQISQLLMDKKNVKQHIERKNTAKRRDIFGKFSRCDITIQVESCLLNKWQSVVVEVKWSFTQGKVSYRDIKPAASCPADIKLLLPTPK